MAGIFEVFNKRLAQFKKSVPKQVAANAVKFFVGRFTAQSWLDSSEQPWAPRKAAWGRKKDTGRAILVKSGRLRRSIRTTEATFDNIVIASMDVPYARAHNEGFEGEVTQNLRAHTRRAHKRKGYTTATGRKVKPTTVAEHTVGPFTRKRKVSLPARRFMGHSQALTDQTTAILEQGLERLAK